MKRQKKSFPARAGGALVAALLAAAALVSPATAAFAAPALEDGDTVYVGPVDRFSGSGFTFPIYAETPADPGNPGEPDFWAYCIEHSENYQHSREALIGGLDSFLGDNHFPNPEVQGKVLWVLAHSYPALSLEALGAAAGVSDLSREDAITATQTAIWRYTDLTWDASWDWGSEDAETVYWHLVNSANASSGLSPADFETSVSITAPGGVQSAGSLVGPFVVTTNQPTVSVSVDPAISLTDADGVPIDPATVVDGQEIYLDLTGETAAGSATLTASATGSSSTGKVISVPTTPGGTPTVDDHAQTLILVAPSTATTDAAADVSWSPLQQEVPVIGTSLVDAADGDRVLAWNGGVVVDTVAYENLIPGQEYTLVGELMDKSDGSGTGITGSVTFTPEEPNGEIDVLFTVPEGYASSELVAFEWLFEGAVAGDPEDAVAEHTDIDDPAQTVTVEDAPVVQDPVIGTSLVDSADGDRVLPWNGGTVIDTVAYQNLTPGVEYTLTGELMDKADGSGTGITGQVTFTPDAADGEVGVTFVVPEGYAGSELVAFEWLFEGAVAGDPEDAVAEHTDIDDPAQTVTVEEVPATSAPVIGTSLVDAADGDRVLAWNGGVVVDTVAYENLVPGQEYTLVGELMDKADGSGTGITGSVTFTPTDASGEIDVTFTVPEGYAGSELVAFEWLFEGSVAGDPGDAVAEHTDINDPAQTVTVENVPVAVVSDELSHTGAEVSVVLLAFAFAAVALGAVLLTRRRATQ